MPILWRNNLENFITFKPLSLNEILSKTDLCVGKREDSRDNLEVPLWISHLNETNFLWLDVSVDECPDNIYMMTRYGDDASDKIIKILEELSGQTIYSEHHRYYPYIFDGIFDDGFNSVDEMIKLIELDLSKPNPKFKDE